MTNTWPEVPLLAARAVNWRSVEGEHSLDSSTSALEVSLVKYSARKEKVLSVIIALSPSSAARQRVEAREDIWLPSLPLLKSIRILGLGLKVPGAKY